MVKLIDILLLLLVLGLGVVAWRLITRERRKMQKRIERVRMTSGITMAEDLSLKRKTGEVKKGLVYWVTKPLPDSKRLGDFLERAGKTTTPKQYIFTRALTVLGILFVVSGVFGKNPLLGLFIGIIFGLVVPLKLLQFRIAKKNRAFLQLFPDAIDLIVRGLRSGLPVSESLVLVSQEVPAPVGPAFATVSQMMKLGVTLEKALQETAHKLDLAEFNFFTTSILLQRETGGNLSEILNNLSEVLRNRILMRMKIKAMSSEARASTIIIGALPFVVILAVLAISPDYMAPLWNDYRGNICAGIAAGMMFTGLFIMHRMSNFEI